MAELFRLVNYHIHVYNLPRMIWILLRINIQCARVAIGYGAESLTSGFDD